LLLSLFSVLPALAQYIFHWAIDHCRPRSCLLYQETDGSSSEDLLRLR
jgi:hypothetical protein